MSDVDKVNADLEGISVRQYLFNKWMDELEKTDNGFKLTAHYYKPVKLAWWKCWFWWCLHDFILGTNYLRFRGWKIGHCLNCDANPYDGTVEAWSIVEAWSFDSNLHRGALIRCNKCRQLRWQPAYGVGRDY